MNGTIKTKTDKGFGFISREGEDKDLFFHSSELNGVTFDELQVGAAVTFDVVNGEKGPSAKSVRLAQASEAAVPAETAEAVEATEPAAEEPTA